MLKTDPDVLEFSPAMLRLRMIPPRPLPGMVLRALLALLLVVLAWVIWGRLDVVAVAQGKIVPRSSLKIVQPAEQGIVREILVSEGEVVQQGQVLIRMDGRFSEADRRVAENELGLKALQLRRIDAELLNQPMQLMAHDDPVLFSQVEAQRRARRQALEDAVAGERALLARARQDMHAAREVEHKLARTLPIYREQAEGWDKLAREGFAGRLMVLERKRLLIENEQDLRAQQHSIAGLQAAIAQSERRIAQLFSAYREQLQRERVEAAAQHHRLEQEVDKHRHRTGLLELRAPQAATVKDLATRTPGTVVAPGTILLTLVPRGEPLIAEVWVGNADAGQVRAGQRARLKIAAYPFQKYGMLEGEVRQIGADAQDRPGAADGGSRMPQESAYRALVDLRGETLEGGGRHALMPGMLVNAEIHLGTRAVWEYLSSPLRRVVHEAGRER